MAVSTLITTVAPRLAAADPSRDINTYILFAFEHIDFKGRNADPTRGFITGGNVGVHPIDDFDPNEILLSLGANGAVVMSDGTQVVADSGRLNNNANLYDLYINSLVGDSAPGVRHTGPTGFAAPILPNLPPPPVCNPGTTDVTVMENAVINLTPGSYGDVRVHDDGTLNIAAGNYQLKSLICGRRVTINTVTGTVITISEDMHFNNGSWVGPACDVQFRLCSNNVDSNNSTVSFGRNTTFYGCIYAPYGRINLGHSTDLYGKFWANTVGSDWNVNMEFCGDVVPVTEATTWGSLKARIR